MKINAINSSIISKNKVSFTATDVAAVQTSVAPTINKLNDKQTSQKFKDEIKRIKNIAVPLFVGAIALVPACMFFAYNVNKKNAAHMAELKLVEEIAEKAEKTLI